MKMKQQAPESLVYTKRHGYMTAQYAVRDIYDALVELITNCDDSYHRIGNEEGQILIEIERRHKGKSYVIIRDKAEGISLEEMRKKIKKVGDLTSANGDRGFMARGAKDCAVLGKVTFESIKDGRYSKCEVLPSMDFVPYSPSERATEQIHNRIKIPRGNGTVVTIETNPNVRIPRHETLVSDLPKIFSLRDIMHKDSGKKVFLRNLNENARPDKLIYQDPGGEVVIDEKFEVSGYPGAIAQLIICKANSRLDDPPDKRFRRTGIFIKGERAIHEVTLFAREFEDESYAEFYFGKLTCSFIDKLCKEYDERRESGLPHLDNNPILLIDPNRQAGLRREHPFTKALFRIPTERLRSLVAKDKEKEREKRAQIENKQTKEQLKKLAKAASKFIRDKIEEFEEFTLEGGMIESKEFTKKGVLIIPNSYTLSIGEVKTFVFRAKKVPGISPEEKVKVTRDDNSICIITSEFLLSPSRTSEGILTGSFKVQGAREIETTYLRATYNGLPQAEALISVVKSKIEEIEIPNGFAFERKAYRIREGKKKRLLLRAKYPSVIAEDSPIEASSNCDDIVILRPRALLRPIAGTNYAEGYVTIQGRRLGAKGKITAKVHGYIAETKVKVIQAGPEEGIPIEIKIRDEDYGNFRAKWDRPEHPNWLLISARYDSIRRYLGPGPQFEGQNSPHFKLLLAEIVSENVTRKILENLEKQASWDYENLGIEHFYALHNKLMKQFNPIAHEIQLSKLELKTLKYEDFS